MQSNGHKLPNDLGKGGKRGARNFLSIPEDIKKKINRRLHAEEDLSVVVDNIVDKKYIHQITKTQNLRQNRFYKDSADDTLFDENDMSLNRFGHLCLFIGGSIIEKLGSEH